MKRFCIAFVLFFTLVQAQEKTYTVKESDLTEDQRRKVSQQDIQQNVNWVTGMGKEVGTAIREGLGALNDETNKFSQSPAGKFTMFIIAYKVIGKDVFRALFAVPMWFLGTLFFIFVFYRNCVIKRVLISKEGPWYARNKKYEVVDPLKTRTGTAGEIWAAHGLAYVIFTVMWSMILFIGG